MTMEIQIPFAGFYESKWSGLIDDAASAEAEWACERQADTDSYDYQENEALRIPEFAFHEAIQFSCDYRAAYYEIAKDYVDLFNQLIKDELNIDLGLSFKFMSSPRFYNFDTDRIFSDITPKVARRMLAYSRKLDKHETLRRIIKERHTSYDGFISYYSNLLTDWLSRPVTTWDHNELCTLLCVLVAQLGEDYDWRIYEALAESTHSYLDDALDWPKYRKRIADARQELQDELDENPDLRAVPYRCDQTPDLFAP